MSSVRGYVRRRAAMTDGAAALGGSWTEDHGFRSRLSRTCLVVGFGVGLCVFSIPMAGQELASVAGATISAEEVQHSVERSGLNLYDAASFRVALEGAVAFERLALEARRLGLDREPEIARRIKELLVQELVRLKVDEQLETLEFDEDQLRTYCEAHAEEFRRPTTARARILTMYRREGEDEAIRARARKALLELKRSLRPELVVREYSDDPGERTTGGLSPAFVEGQPGRRYPAEVSDALFGLSLRGDIAGPVETPRALYLVQLVERRPGEQRSFEAVRDEVRRRLAAQARADAYGAYCRSLEERYPATVNTNALESLVRAPQPGDRPPGPPGSTVAD